MIPNYLTHFTHLRTDASRARWSAATRHRAPHKPLLLLAVTDLFAQGDLDTNLIELTPDLGETFTLYWARVMPPDRRGNLAMPFFHLKSDGFRHLVPRPGKQAILAASRRIHSIYQLRETILGARLDDELYALLCAQRSRDLLRTALIETYFAPELQPALAEQGLVNLEAFHYSQALLEQARTQQAKEHPAGAEHPRPAARDQGFRRAIVRAYDHRCVLTPDGHTAVEAAHIVPWSTSYDDAPHNGMALCRLCHWIFDEGLVGVSARYVVIASPQLSARSAVSLSNGIMFPVTCQPWPAGTSSARPKSPSGLVWRR